MLEAQELVPRVSCVNYLVYLIQSSEQARVLGIDFYSVFSRGSQFKVESLMLRIAKAESFMLISPSRKQVGNYCLRFLAIVRLGSRMPSSAFPSSWNRDPISIQALCWFWISSLFTHLSSLRIIIGKSLFLFELTKLFLLSRKSNSLERPKQAGFCRPQASRAITGAVPG
jgi:hypothetical protein